MKTTTKLSLLAGLFCFCLYSCDYEFGDDNYVDVAEPETTDFKILWKADMTTDGKIIANYEYLRFDVDDYPKDQYTMRVSWWTANEDAWMGFYYTENDRHYIPVSSSYWGSGYTKLKVEFVTKKKGESIKDQITYNEATVTQSQTWSIEFQPKSKNLQVSAEREGNQVTIQWNQPDPNYGEVSHYEVQTYSPNYENFQTTETSYTISDFDGGSVRGNVYAVFKEDYLNYWRGEYSFYYDYEY